MKKRSIRAVALTLAAALTLGPAASASQALGTEIHMGKTTLASGVEYTRQHLWSATYSDLRTERYIEYTPNETVQPALAYGDNILARNTLSALAAGLEQEGKRVVGGVNGDYYVVATGAPLGLVVTDGVVRSSSDWHYALGFDETGNAFIGKPDLAITATIGDTTYAIGGGLNKIRTTEGGYVLYTEDFGPSTKHTEPGVDVILAPNTDKLGQTVSVDLDVEQEPVAEPTPPEQTPTEQIPAEQPPAEPVPEDSVITDSSQLEVENVPQDGETAEEIVDTLVYTDRPIVGGRMECTVVQVLSSTQSIAIPEGCLVLSINSQADQALVDQLSALQAGEIVEIDITSADARWETAVTAVGGLYKLVTEGQVESGLAAEQAPRTAAGIKADGTVIFYTVDGRQSGYSVGASMTQVAKRLVELGCVEAICLDGGGSTTLGATLPGQGSFGILNQPSDGTQRAVSNALFLVAQQANVGQAEQLLISPGDAIMLAGAQLELSTTSVDKLGQTVVQYQPNEVRYTMASGNGSVTDGVLTAGAKTETAVLTATAGDLTGEALITVVDTPNKIRLHDQNTGSLLTAIHLEPGETIDLTASAVYRNLPLISQDENFVWQVTEGTGTVGPDGTLMAGGTAGSGTLSVTAGACTVTIPVTVSGHIYTVEDFEGDFSSTTNSLTARIEPETGAAYVRRGRQSARISYDMGESGFAAVGVNFALQEGERYLALWVYGDGSGNTLTAPVYTADGASREEILAVLNFTGWQRVILPLPTGTRQILTLKITPTGTTTRGTVWLDQVTSSGHSLADDLVPQVTVTLTETLVEPPVETELPVEAPTEAETPNEIPNGTESQTETETPDQTETPEEPSPEGEVQPGPEPESEPEKGPTVLLTLNAGVSDNVDENFSAGQLSVTYDGQSIPFDWDGTLLTAQLPESDGLAHRVTVTAIDASGNVGRASVDLAATALRDAPFADTANHWAERYVTYLYDQGISNGVIDANGVAWFNPNLNITRGEFALMASRWLGLNTTQYSGVELPFVDAGAVPTWCLDAVKAMYALGIMQGSTGQGGRYAYAGSSITRAEAMTMLGRIQTKGYAAAELTYADADSIPTWAADYVATMVAQGVVTGYGDNTVAPTAPIKRGEMAKILYAMR